MARVETIKGDITKIETDAIVNAANKELRPGGGVDGAIHRAGGPAIAEEARAIAQRDGDLATGEAVATTAGALPSAHVIHTVGPIWSRHTEEEAVRLLASCYKNSLDLAVELGCDSIAFPNISTGVYGFPKRLAGETAVRAVEDWVGDHPGQLERVIFVAFDNENLEIYEGLLVD
jgi:O-acetyl-ADP-ribose deacetylase (regulator of RNase III)